MSEHSHVRAHDPGYGNGEATIEGEELGVEESELRRAIMDTFASSSYKPPLAPSVALELHSLVAKPNAQFSDLEKLLVKDPMLAARVLRIAQSPALAGRSKIASLKDAAVRLGLRRLGDVFMETAMGAKVFRAKGFEEAMDRLLSHSVLVARAARALAVRTSISPDHAFLVGLLHDIGFAAALIVVAEGMANKRFPKAEPARAIEAAESVHAEASGLIGRLWGLPDDVTRALLGHHHFAQGGVPFHDGALVLVAEAIVPPRRVSLEPPPHGAAVARAALSLRLDPKFVAGLREELARAEQSSLSASTR